MQRPLTKNQTAKELKKFFRKNHIKYWTVNTMIIPDDHRPKNFPPLVFNFHKTHGIITIWDKSKITAIYHYEAYTISQLFEYLMYDGVLTATIIKNLL